MLDHQHAATVFRSDVEDQLAQLVRFGGRKPGGWLVEQQEVRIDGERARQPDAAFFAVAETGGETMCFLAQPQVAEDIGRTLPRLGASEPLRDIADLDVLADGQPAEQAHGLEGPHHAGTGKAVARQTGAVAFADHDRAGERPLESGQHVDQGRLAGAVRADQSEDLAALEPDTDLIDGNQAAEPDAHRLRRKVHG